jgi:hypothetical protein
MNARAARCFVAYYRVSTDRQGRSKAALAAAKARGTKLGNPPPAGAVKRIGAALKAQTGQFAGNVLPIIREIQRAGHSSHNAIAAN